VLARAQQPDMVRRVGVIMGFSVQNSEAERRVAAFERKLAELGWKNGIDLQIEYRWPGNPPDRLRADIAEIVRLNPDAILVTNEPTLSFTSVATSTIPIVFANVTNAILALITITSQALSPSTPRWPKNGFQCSKTSCLGLNASAFCMRYQVLPKSFSNPLMRLLLRMD
jgi:hypothetical protein